MVGNLPETPLEFAQYFATLPGHRWIKMVLVWQPQGHRRSGRPKCSWDTLLTIFCRWKNFSSWEVSAIDVELWRSNLPDFFFFPRSFFRMSL